MEKVKVNDISIKKLYNYVSAIEDECGGFIIGEKDTAKGLYKITDIIFLKLSVSRSADFEVDDDAIFEFMQNSPELIPKVIGWWHTHPYFDTFFSGIDKDTFKVLNNLFRLPIGVVINKYNDWYWSYMDRDNKLIELKNIEASQDTNLYKMEQELILEAEEKTKHSIKSEAEIFNITMNKKILNADISVSKNKFFSIPIKAAYLNKVIKDNKLTKGDNFLYDEETYEVL